MTISTTIRKAGPFTGTGASTNLPFTFKVFSWADVRVTRTSASGAETVLTAGYSVTLNADQDANPGGYVTTTTPVGELTTLTSQVAATQPMDLTNAGGFFPDVLDDSADRQMMVLQQLAEEVSRTLRAPVSSTEPLNGLSLPDAGDRAGKLLAFDAAGRIVAATSTSGPGDGGLRTDLAQAGGAALIGYGASTVNAALDELLIEPKTILIDQAAVPATAPTLAINAAAGNLNGTYYYAVTYVTAEGETDRGPLAGPISPVNQQIDLTSIPLSPDAGVTARKIYRTTGAGGEPNLLKLVTTISNNLTTTYTDNLADGGLGANVPFLNTTGGLISINGQRILASGTQSLAFGFGSQALNTGYSNTSFGHSALADNVTGYRNAAFGLYAMQSNRGGSRSTAMGVHALGGMIDNNDNSAFGYAAGINAWACNSSVFMGASAAENIYAGDGNVAIGATAMQQATWTTAPNTAVGFEAGRGLTTGGSNCFFGTSAGYGAAATINNVYVGAGAGYAATGSGNIFIGYNAGHYETAGNSLFIDNQLRANEADQRAKAIIYGYMDANPAAQILNINANLYATGALVKFTGISTTAAAANAVIDNAAFNSLLRSTSSLIYKTEIEPMDRALAHDIVGALSPIWYRSLADADRKDWSWYGLGAEDVAPIDPRLVTWTRRQIGEREIEVEKEVVTFVPREITKTIPRKQTTWVNGTLTEIDVSFEIETVEVERVVTVEKVTEIEPIYGDLVPDGIQYDRIAMALLIVAQDQKAAMAAMEVRIAAIEASLVS